MNTERADEDPQPGSDGWSAPSIWLILLALLVAATGVFIVQNGDRVAAEFLWFDRSIRLWVAIVASIVIGVVLDRLILTWWRRSSERRNR